MPSTLYRLNSVVDLHWAHWDDEYVVFDQASGQTHHLDPLRAFVVNALTEAPQDLTGLVSELASFPGLGDAADLGRTLSGLLNELVTTGLVEADTL